MKSKIESGAKGRAVAGASAGSRRGVASVGREIERIEIDGGYAAMVGKKTDEGSGREFVEWLQSDGEEVLPYLSDCVYTDFSTACQRCAEYARGVIDGDELCAFPPPEYPRVVYVRLSASVMGVA